MDRQTLAALLERRPFEPFVVTTSDGGSFEIRHPEVAALGKSRLVIVDPDSDRLVICALLHITNVQMKAAA